MQDYDFDYFVIGAGSAGVRSARIAAGLGARTGIAEARFFGGTCVNVGCVPKKLYTYAAHARDEFIDSRAYGWQVNSMPDFNWATLKNNKDEEIARLNGIYQDLLSNAGVSIFKDYATLEAPNTLKVKGERITARHILIAAGGKPFLPDIPGIEHALVSDDFFALEQQPRSVVVVGGGYIATELAGVFAGVGSQVELVYRGGRLLRGFDEDIREFLTEAATDYLNLRLNTQPVSIEAGSSGSGGKPLYNVTFDDGNSCQAEAVVYATGRSPATADLGLANCGVETADSGAIKVDKHFQTSAPGIYAVGDVIQRVTLTPVALAEGQRLAQHLFGGASFDALDYDLIPSAVFSEPQIATVGFSEEQARERFGQLRIYKSRFRPLKHTLTKRERFSLVKMIVDDASDRVVGIHLAGADAAEIMQGMAVAVQAGATKAQFDATLGIHPTSAEELVTLRTPV